MIQEAQAACLDEEAVSELLHGSLDESRRLPALRHLADCSRCRLILARAAQGAFTTDPALLDSGSITVSTEHAVLAEESHAQPRIGDVVADKYRIEKTIGRGGMGIVFAAVHIELGHRVAIKVLRHIGGQSINRFLREAQTSVRFASEHVVRVFDLGRLPGSLPYILMEYLEGEDLARHLARGPLPLREALQYTLEICDALQEAHSAGIVHRDLKPANVFLCDRGQNRRTIKVLDFGISKSLTAGREPSLHTLTDMNAVIGSPAYMSPEQMQALRDLDARTDIWSLGVVLYEMLSGKLPFRGRTFSALAIEIATREPVPLARELQLPAAVVEIVTRCLAKDRAERFQNVGELVRALQAACAALDEPKVKRVPKRLMWSLAGLSVLLLIAAMIWPGRHERVEAPAQQVAISPPISAPDPPASLAVPEVKEEPPPNPSPNPIPKPRRTKPKVKARPADTPAPPGPTDTPD